MTVILTYDGRMVGSLDDTARWLDDSLHSDAGRLNNSQCSDSDMHAEGLYNSLYNVYSDAGRLDDSQVSDSYIHAGRPEKFGSNETKKSGYHIFGTDKKIQ